eukprot:7129451-Pyramimonas_sp.AAC.1
MHSPAHVGTPHHEDRGPVGSSTESGAHTAALTTAYGCALRQNNFLAVSPQPRCHEPSGCGRARLFGSCTMPFAGALRGSDSERQAGASLLHELLSLYASCRLNAKQFCVLCGLCEAAGVQGATWSKFSRPADLQSGKYQLHLDTVLPAPKHLTHIKVPVCENHSALRSVRDHPIKLFYESISDELVADPSILEELRKTPAQRDPNVLDVPAYAEHPATKIAKET